MVQGGGELPGVQGKEAGWYPLGENPNDQAYWDGQSWTARRRWAGAGWADMPFVNEAAGDAGPGRSPLPPVGVSTAGYQPGYPPGYQPGFAGPYGYAGRPAGVGGSLVSLTPASLALFLSGIVIMVGSVTPWISISLLGHTLSVAGTDDGISATIGISGWITFTAGVVLLLLGGLMIASRESSLRVVALLVALVSVGLAAFAVVRVLQKISESHPTASQLRSSPIYQVFAGTSANVGFGLILVAVAATVALIAAAIDLRATSST
ncbi:MAG TPA: hypothetical protein VN799_08215 [Acidimicrobiales bacterium]|nr:hypothetical protein [Acidimicrobiales bacterium]